MPPRPAWVFDSLLLRRALGDVNLPAVPAIVRAACGLSQRDLAAIAGWNPATLSYYEHGQRDGMFDVRTVLHFADAVGMPRSTLLALVFTDAGAEDNYGAEPGWRGSGSPAVAGLPAVNIPPAATRSHVRYWQACTNTLYIQGRAVGGAALLSPALQQWQRVASAVQGTDGGGQGQQLRAVAGELALSAGLVALDAERLPLARSLYKQARGLAINAGDVMLSVCALASQSMLCAEIARTGASRESARQALRLAYQATDEGRYVPVPQLHALIALCRASAASLLGDKAGFTAATGQARRELSRNPQDGEPPQRLRHVNEAEITANEAAGYLNLGEAGRSAMLYRQALACNLSPRNRAVYGAGLADALLKQGARREAVAAAMDVLPALEGGVTSMRCLNSLRVIRQAADTIPGAQEFRERFDVALGALAATCDLHLTIRDAPCHHPA